jgi:hypothetical protein
VKLVTKLNTPGAEITGHELRTLCDHYFGQGTRSGGVNSRRGGESRTYQVPWGSSPIHFDFPSTRPVSAQQIDRIIKAIGLQKKHGESLE